MIHINQLLRNIPQRNDYQYRGQKVRASSRLISIYHILVEKSQFITPHPPTTTCRRWQPAIPMHLMCHISQRICRKQNSRRHWLPYVGVLKGIHNGLETVVFFCLFFVTFKPIVFYPLLLCVCNLVLRQYYTGQRIPKALWANNAIQFHFATFIFFTPPFFFYIT